MSHPTLFTLATLVDNRGVYALGRLEGTIREDAPGLPYPKEQELRELLQPAMTKILELETLTKAELEACHQALDWYSEFEESEDIPLDGARRLLDLWNLPDELPHRIEALDLGRAIFMGSLSEGAMEKARLGVTEPLVVAPGAGGRENGSRSTVSTVAVQACKRAEIRLRRVRRGLEEGRTDDAAGELAQLIDELRWVRGRFRG